MARREQYEFEVPEFVHVLTQAVDVQANRWEIEIKGWGPGEESAGIKYITVYGDTSQREAWAGLWDHLNQEYQSPFGSMKPEFTFIDHGYQSDEVEEFCYKYRAYRTYACKGSSEVKKPLISAPNKHKLKDGRREIDLYTIGTNAGKMLVFKRLSIETPGPGYCHFPLEYTKEYFDQLNSEHCVTRKRAGQLYKVFELRPGQSRRNEPLDLTVYNTAGIKFLNPVWSALEERRLSSTNEAYHEKPQKSVRNQLINMRRKPRNFVTGWRE